MMESMANMAAQARMRKAYGAEARKVMEETWILEHLPLVRHIVNKLVYGLGNKVDKDDLISAGTLGLVKAAQSFDPNRDVIFKTYAYIRIRGAVLDELRSEAFVPSLVRKEIRHIEETYRSLMAESGLPPTDERLAETAGITVERMYKVLEEGRRQSFLSIHGMDDEKPTLNGLMPVDHEPSPDQQVERKEQIDRLTDAILSLPDRDRHVLLLYYERDLTMKETAAVLGVTESRVSQLHASALFKLSMKMGRIA